MPNAHCRNSEVIVVHFKYIYVIIYNIWNIIISFLATPRINYNTQGVGVSRWSHFSKFNQTNKKRYY